MDGWVALTGAGPGDEGLLTLRAVQLLGMAGLVVADPALAHRVRNHINPGAELAEPDNQTTRRLVEVAKGGRLAVRLYDGDPLLSGAATDASALTGVRVEIVPAVAPVTAVPAYAGISLRGEELRVAAAADVSQLSYGRGTVIITGGEAAPADLGKMLIAAGWPDSTPMAITWDGTTTDQQTVVTSLGRIGPDLKAAGVTLANTKGGAVAVVGDAVKTREDLNWFETKPLFGWRVLVPRTKEQAGSVSDRLREYGAVPVEVPTIAVEPPRTPQQMERAVKGLVTGRYQWVAFTSVNAVRAIREKFEEYGLDARAFAGVKVAAVGGQTAQALKEFGIRPDLIPAERESAEGLADEWPPFDDLLDPINKVLLPRADIATETLVARLSDLGWEAEDVTAYRTVRAAPPPAEIREAIKGGGFDAVLFTSSSTVRNLVGIAGKPHAVTAIAVIGPQTAKTAAEFGLRVDVTSPQQSATALVDALAAHGAKLREAAATAGEIYKRPTERRRGGRRPLGPLAGGH